MPYSTSSARSLRWSLLFACALVGCWLGPAAAFDEDVAFSYLEQQVAFGPRNPGGEGHEACLDWMIAHLKSRADAVEPHTFVIEDPYGSAGLRLTNVLAIFNPGATVRVAFGAHWDSRPRADREDPPLMDTAIAGANDGASGVAVLLALADWLKENPPSMGVDLVFFDGEDYGLESDHENYLLGSQRFATDHPAWRPAALVVIDMIGDADLRIPMEGYSLRYNPSLVHVVFNRAAQLGLDAFEAVESGAVLDDHVPFLQRGIAAVDLIDLDYGAWHTRRDTPDQCSARSLGQVGRLLTGLIQLDFAQGQGLRY